LAGAIPANSPEPPVAVLLVASPEVPSRAGAGVNAEDEAVDFAVPKEKEGIVLPVSPEVFFVARLANRPVPAVVLVFELKSPTYGGLGDGIPKRFTLDDPVGGANNPPLGFVLAVPESAGFVACQLNTGGVGFILSGFGEGTLSSPVVEMDGFPVFRTYVGDCLAVERVFAGVFVPDFTGVLKADGGDSDGSMSFEEGSRTVVVNRISLTRESVTCTMPRGLCFLLANSSTLFQGCQSTEDRFPIFNRLF
jgi:hypothetical protein